MKLKLDVSGSDPEKAAASAGYEGPMPRSGVHKAKIVEATVRFHRNERTGREDKKSPRDIEVVAEIIDGKYKGWRGWDYVSLSEAAEWKLDQFGQAVGWFDKAKKRTANPDTDKLKDMKVKIRTGVEKYEQEERAKIRAWIKWDGEDTDDETEDEESEDEVEDEESEDEEEENEDEESEEEEEEEEPEYPHYDEAELTSMDLAGLKSVCSDLELTPDAKTLKKKSLLVPWILENQPNQEEDESEDEEEEEEEGDNYDEMSDDDLRTECEDREIKITAKTSRANMIKKLREDDEEEPF